MNEYILTYFAHKTVLNESVKLLVERKGCFTTSHEQSPLDDGYTGVICSFKYLEDLNRFVYEAFHKYGVYFYIYNLIGGPK